jgi:hypothetical protein
MNECIRHKMPRAIFKQKCSYCSRLYTPCKACLDEVLILEIGDTCQRCYVSKGLEEAREKKVKREKDDELFRSRFDETQKKYDKIRLQLQNLVKQYKEMKGRSLSQDSHSNLQTPQTLRGSHLHIDMQSVNFEEMEKMFVHLHELGKNLDTLCDSKDKLSDITIECGSKKFRVHSLILSTRSSIWKQLCKNALLEKSHHIRIDEMKSDILKEILHYTYSGRCNVDQINALDIYIASERFQLKFLKASVENYLLETIEETTALGILQAFDKFKNEKMKTKCINLINSKLTNVFNSLEWNRIKTLNPDLVYQVYESRINN